MVVICLASCSWLNNLNPWADKEVKEDVNNGVNHYLWQAGLEKVGGVIVTDWTTMAGIGNEQFKITINILSKNLRADCLKVMVSKKVFENGEWGMAQPDKRVADEIEKAILTRARELYRRDYINEE